MINQFTSLPNKIRLLENRGGNKMGSFSWTRADKVTKRKNLTQGDQYKILIPEEFGGGYIVDTYYDYGYVFYENANKSNADLYGILAYWNHCEDMHFDGEEYPSTMDEILARGNTCEQHNREKGIKIGCYNEDVEKLKYPLKLVSMSYKGTYEDCTMRSYSDPEQGFGKTYWEEECDEKQSSSTKQEMYTKEEVCKMLTEMQVKALKCNGLIVGHVSQVWVVDQLLGQKIKDLGGCGVQKKKNEDTGEIMYTYES